MIPYMKHFYKATSTFLFLAAFVACGEDSVVDSTLINGNSATLQHICITGEDFVMDGGARSTVEINNDGVQFLWSANDTVGIFPNTGDQVSFAMDEGIGMQTATFNGGGWALKHSATYSAYYPYNFYNRNLIKIPVAYTGQTQTGNASTAHIGAYDYMAASVATPENGSVAFDMQHMGCLVMLQTNLDEAKTLTAVELKAQDAVFAATGTMDLTAVTPVISATAFSDALTITLADFQVAKDETATIYFMMAPTNLSGETLEITLSDETDAYIKYEVAGKDFVAGKAYAYQLSEGEKLGTLPEYAVDLGLPSGTLWADRNVGADAPEAFGDFFAWGETEPKETYSWATYLLCNGSASTLTKYCNHSNSGTVDGKSTLDLEDDAAYVKMGKDWRMPTTAEQQELMTQCTREWTTQNGVQGYKLTGPNKNSIFLPAAGYHANKLHLNTGPWGYYRSSTLFSSSSTHANILYFDNGSYNCGNRYFRFNGYSVRAVVR